MRILRTIVLLGALPGVTSAQQLATVAHVPVDPPAASATRAVALRVTTPPVIDGRDDDAIWAQAQRVEGFRQYQPRLDTAPTFATEARVAYDDRYLYVLIRAFDPHPDSIISLLSRRDVKTTSDQLKVMIDSYHDRRTGYEFAVNPAGVKRDYYTFNDNNEDDSWDGIWDVATRIDSLGWLAEFRIPFSQLRFPRARQHTFGIMISREIARFNERDSWPLYNVNKTGIASQFGELSGIGEISASRHLEMLPYVVTKNVTRPATAGWSHPQQLTGGADVKYGVTSNLTLDGTVNPDFGQVEADPAVLNLSSFETFFQEKRPFFIEGTGIFRFDLSCSDGNCSGLFYSRRIGRAPQLSDGDAATPTATTILGAGKLTGRIRNGLSVGVLEAVTGREQGALDQTVEPRTNYVVGRLQQELRGGATVIGGMVTGVNRSLDRFTTDTLRREAYTGGIDIRHQFLDRRYQLSGFVAASHLAGSASAIALTQESSVHNYQRPDAHVALDTLRTTLGGDAEQLELDKIGGGALRFSSSFQRFSPGFDANDVGFLRRADQQNLSTWVALQFHTPRMFYRQLFLNFNQWTNWNTGGLSALDRTGFGGNFNAHAELHNSWWGHFGIGVDAVAPVYDDRVARGGPAVRADPSTFGWMGIEGDTRLAVSPQLWFNWWRSPKSGSYNWNINPFVTLRIGSPLSVSLGTFYLRNVDQAQWLENLGDPAGVTHYTFGHLKQQTLSLTSRVDYTIKPNLSLQVYAAPYVSAGTYSDWRELGDARSPNFALRYVPFTPSDTTLRVTDHNFNFLDFHTNWVVRWEYRPGSTLFLVWTQGRDVFNEGRTYGGFDAQGNTRDLFALHPDNTLLIKVSYWFSP